MKTPEVNQGFSEIQMVRRERDSNPRSDKSETAFRVRRIQPDSAISPKFCLVSSCDITFKMMNCNFLF